MSLTLENSLGMSLNMKSEGKNFRKLVVNTVLRYIHVSKT